MVDAPDMFDKVRLAPEVDSLLRDSNPWWNDKPGRLIPTYRRWPFDVLRKRIEKPLAPVIVLRGARQVGKTTLQEQLIQHLLKERGVHPQRILRVQFDELPALRSLEMPILAIVRWFENRILGRTLNQAAHAGQNAFLFLDEVQNLSDWAPQIKTLVDLNTVMVAVTGSSALRIEAGRDSLAGRITTVEIGSLLLREVSGLRFGEEIPPLLQPNGLDPLREAGFWRELQAHGEARRVARDRAFEAFSERGGYPLVHTQADAGWAELAQQLNENVVKRVIQHDLRMGERGRKRDEQLLEEVFRLACRYAGQAPGAPVLLAEIKHVLRADVSYQRLLNYLKFLDGALLVRLIRPLEIRLKRAKGSNKLCLTDHGLRASWLGEVVPLDARGLDAAPHLADLAGHVAESVTGAFLSLGASADLTHFPERGAEPEVDFVLTLGDRRIPVEVKYRRRIDPIRDTFGLRSFVEKAHYNAPFGVLVTQEDGVKVDDPRILPVSLRSLLLMR